MQMARVVGLLAVVFASGAGAAGCGKKSLGGGDDDGAVRVALTLPGGAIVNTVNYEITGNGITPITGSIDVSAPGTTQATALVSGLAPGMYTVSMTATVVGNNGPNCMGTAPFTIVAGQTAMANVILQCVTPPKTGSTAITGTVDQCPFITSISATSLQALQTKSITVSVSAFDIDAGSVISYSWTQTPSASIGTFGTPNAATTTFTCAGVGRTTLSIAVSHGLCGDSLVNAIPVECLSGIPVCEGTETNPPPSLAAGCKSCLLANFSPTTDGCCGIETSDAIGFNLCIAASACMRPCNQAGDTTTCFCGSNQATCDQPGQANGLCVAQLTAAAGRNVVTQVTDMPTAAQVLARFGDPNYAIGRAVNIQAVAGAFCAAECGF